MDDYADVLFEIGTEELPPTSLYKLSNALVEGFSLGLRDNHLQFKNIYAFATPRRLAVFIEDCHYYQSDLEIIKRGPPFISATDAAGNFTKAAEGFAASCNTSVDKLHIIESDQGKWLAFNLRTCGNPSHELLPSIANAALTKLPIPKKMRWGSGSELFIRPVHWILFIHGTKIISCNILGVGTSNLTYGHRFHHPASIMIHRPSEYVELLEQSGFVIPDYSARRGFILNRINEQAGSLGLSIDPDDALLDEITSLTEWPVPIAGTFDESYLNLPHEVVVLTMKKNQKFIPLYDNKNQLTNHFITIANLDSPQPGLIKQGNERVIRPRLSDAQFFWQQDCKFRLEERIDQLKHIIFHNGLGSMYDKTLRVCAIASYVAAQFDIDIHLVERSAMLSRCDLVTNMVFEFPEMQGIMGKHLALLDKESQQLAYALAEFYMPRFSGDSIPASPVGKLISLADKVDTLVGIFSLGIKPSGDKDPFGLRRNALGIIRILLSTPKPVHLLDLLEFAAKLLPTTKPSSMSYLSDATDFLFDRLKGIFIDKGFTINCYESVLSASPDTLIDFDRRMHALQHFVSEYKEVSALIELNKRIRNILRPINPIPTVIDESIFQVDAETELFITVSTTRDLIQSKMMNGEYYSALIDLYNLKPVIERFFTNVLVMDSNIAIRNNRLALLFDLQGLLRQISDFSRL